MAAAKRGQEIWTISSFRGYLSWRRAKGNSAGGRAGFLNLTQAWSKEDNSLFFQMLIVFVALGAIQSFLSVRQHCQVAVGVTKTGENQPE